MGRQLIAGLIALVLFAAATPARAAADLAIVGAAIVDAGDAAARTGQTILIEGDRIARIGPASQVTVPEGVPVLDARGKWVIPGLIDAHVHFFQSGGLFTRPDVIDLRDVRPYEDEIRRIREGIDTTFARYIASGVTGVVDMGGPLWTFDVREKAERMERAPRVAAAGPLLATMVPREYEDLDDPPILHVESRSEALDAAEMILKHEPDLLKVWFVTTDNYRADLEWVRSVVDRAEDASLPVVAHATKRDIAEAVVAAGVDILAHGVEDRTMADDLLSGMAAEGIVYVTTLIVMEGYSEVLGKAVELSPIERRLGDPEVIASWSRLSEPRQLFRPAIAEDEAANLRRAAAAGVTIAAGSDAGNIGTLHGPALHRELELMVEAGLTPHQVLTAATRGGAEAMGRSADLGTVEEGKLADLVILDADPLADIRNTRAIHRVLKGGKLFDPADCCG